MTYRHICTENRPRMLILEGMLILQGVWVPAEHELWKQQAARERTRSRLSSKGAVRDIAVPSVILWNDPINLFVLL